MGYQRTVLFVDKNLKDQTLNFEISRGDVSLKQHEVKANVNFALILLRHIIRRKPDNNYDRLSNYRYEIYNKLELDIKTSIPPSSPGTALPNRSPSYSRI